MIKKITTATVAILFLGLLLAVPTEAQRGNRQGRVVAQSTTVKTQVPRGTCPFGYTPGTGGALKQGPERAWTRGLGPRDGSGIDRVRPRDGTGYGAVGQGRGWVNNPNYYGSGVNRVRPRDGTGFRATALGWGRVNNPNYVGSSVNRVRPQDGTGFRATVQGRGRVNNPFCDGTGPRGRNPNRGWRWR